MQKSEKFYNKTYGEVGLRQMLPHSGAQIYFDEILTIVIGHISANSGKVSRWIKTRDIVK